MQAPERPAFRRLTASHGVGWLAQSLALMRIQASRLLLLAVLMQFILGLSQLPLLGFLVVLAVPGLTAGMLEALDATAGGRTVKPGMLFAPLVSSRHVTSLLACGALVFLAGIMTMSLLLSGSSVLADPELVARIEQGDLEAINSLSPEAIQAMLMAFIGGIAVSGTLGYFTIPLIWFRNQRLFGAIGLGLRAMLFNWKPFLALAGVMTLVLVPVALLAGMLFRLAAGAGNLSILVLGLLMIMLLAFQLLIFGGQYCAFREIFGTGRDDTTPPLDPDETLIA